MSTGRRHVDAPTGTTALSRGVFYPCDCPNLRSILLLCLGQLGSFSSVVTPLSCEMFQGVSRGQLCQFRVDPLKCINYEGLTAPLKVFHCPKQRGKSPLCLGQVEGCNISLLKAIVPVPGASPSRRPVGTSCATGVLGCVAVSPPNRHLLCPWGVVRRHVASAPAMVLY